MVRLAFAAAVLVLAFLAGEFFLPRMAEDRLRSDLAKQGEVLRVEVEAFPAFKLLFDHADRVELRMGTARAGQGRFADLLDSTRRTGKLDARAQELLVGPLRMRDLRLGKDGDGLHAEAGVTEADIAAALPESIGLRPVAAGDGALVLEATAGVLGTELAVRARLSTREGALVVAPDGLLGGFASLTVFDDPRLRITGVGARERPDGYTLTADARLAPA